MADSGNMSISPSAKSSGKQPASPDSESGDDDGNVSSLSPEYVAMALWGWSKDIFKDEASSMFNQVCTMVGIPDKIVKRVRRKSMPAITTMKSILKKPEVPINEHVSDLPPARPRAKSYTEPSTSAVSGAVLDLPVDARIVAKLAASANVTAAARTDFNVSAPRVPAEYGVQSQYGQPPLALMQYSEPGHPPRSAAHAQPHQHSMLGHALPYMAPPALSSYAAPTVRPAHTTMQDDDASILMSAVDRCLIPAERLEPDQCQQVLAAHQRFKQPSYASRAMAAQAGPAPTVHRHRNAHERYRSIVIVPPPPPDLNQHPAYRGQNAPTGNPPPLQPDSRARQPPPVVKHVRVDSRNQNDISQSSSSPSRQWGSNDGRRHPGPLTTNPTTPSSSTQPSSAQSGNQHERARKLHGSPLVPQPLQLRKPIQQPSSNYDPKKADNKRIAWRLALNKEVNDINIADEVDQKRSEVQAAQHAKHKRECNRAEAQRQAKNAVTEFTDEQTQQFGREKYLLAPLPDMGLGNLSTFDAESKDMLTSELWKKDYSERRADDETRAQEQAAKAREDEILAKQRYELEQEFEQRLAARMAVDEASNIGTTNMRKGTETGSVQSFFRKQLKSWGSKANFFQ